MKIAGTVAVIWKWVIYNYNEDGDCNEDEDCNKYEDCSEDEDCSYGNG